MSRMQDILDKAEREGVLRPMPPLTMPPVAAPVGSVIADRTVTPPVVIPVAAETTVVHGHLDPILVTAQSSTSATVEQYRALRTRMLHADGGNAVHVVLVTSPGHGEGKSVTVANLGLTLARDGQRRVCVVDADLRTPRMQALFGLPPGPGLSDVLAGRASLDEALVTLDEVNVTVLRAGTATAHPADLLGAAAMRHTMETLRSRFDCIVVDAPPAGPLADVGVLAPLVDSVLLVVRAGVTPKPAIHDAAASLDPSKLLGVVLNQVA
jgi:succinoglycan biosynthesis transport protein ExoP